ncbi:terpenoid synthase [Desarmillaria tabescens]|uniref:Terpene synthase n=1 Tax=Armillaria tabescens TaxID=1929756 RepID=A0AA39JK44_ARMTA|nr:terpenoid synthase [Desarmillaria tabescens]KAK0443682.1 terpenoid synthase [Desarmillaria tabescens]
MSSESDIVIHLPDTLVYWPWSRRINPHYEEVKTASGAWCRSFRAFRPEAQSAFDLCDFSLLSSLAYPTASREHLRTVCDMMNLFFVFDEYTDNATPEVVRQYADIVMDAIRHPTKSRPSDEVVLGVVAQGFWALGIKSASRTSQKRFVECFGHYTDSVVQQAKDRNQCYIRNIQDYFDVRRLTIGAYPSYAMLELGYDLPDEVFHHPTIVALRHMSCDLLIMDNDLASYNKEQALEEYPHNIIASVMNELSCDIGHALPWVEEHHRSIRTKFLRTWAKIPSWGPIIDGLASRYVHGIANWVRADYCWCFESERYFGSNGRLVQEHRMVTLMPKQYSISEPLLIHAYQSA